MNAKITKLPISKHSHVGPTSESLKNSERLANRESLIISVITSVISVAWLFACGIYANYNLASGWLSNMPVYQLGTVLMGAFSPLAFIWLIALYIRRNNDVRQHTDVLRRQFALLTYDAEGRDGRVKLIANALRNQSEELNNASEKAENTLRKLIENLASRTSDLDKASNKVNMQTGGICKELASETEKMANLNSQIENNHKKIIAASKLQEEELVNASRHALENADQISAALKIQAGDIVGASNIAADQARDIGGVFNKYLVDMRGASDDMLSRAKEIDILFKNASQMLGDGVAYASKQSANMMQAADQSSQKITNIKNDITKQSDILSILAQNLAEQSESVNKSVDMQSEGLVNSSQQASEKVKYMSDILTKQANQITQTTDSAAENSKKMQVIFNSHIKSLDNAADISSQKADSIINMLNQHLLTIKVIMDEGETGISTTFKPLIVKIQNMAEELYKQNKFLHNITNDAGRHINHMNDSIAKQISGLRQASASSRLEVHNISKLLKGDSKELDTLAHNLAGYGDHIENSAKQQKKMLNDATNNASEQAVNIVNILKHQVDAVDNAMNIINERLVGAGIVFNDDANNINHTLTKNIKLIENLTDNFKIQSEKMTAISVHSAMQISDNRDALKAQTKELTTAANISTDSLSLAGNAFAMQADNMEKSAIGIIDNLQSLFRTLEDKSNDIIQAGNNANKQITLVGRNITQHSNQLAKTTESTSLTLNEVADKISETTIKLHKIIDECVGKADFANSQFIEQSESLILAASNAAAQAKKLAVKEIDNKRNIFLKTTRFIIEDLNSISVDLTRILNKEVPDSDWKRYTKGDRSIFTRNLLRSKSASLIDKIKQQMKTDHDARQYINRYMEQFNSLLKECEQSDPENLLHSTFLTSDVGKLYILLSNATGRVS